MKRQPDKQVSFEHCHFSKHKYRMVNKFMCNSTHYNNLCLIKTAKENKENKHYYELYALDIVSSCFLVNINQ